MKLKQAKTIINKLLNTDDSDWKKEVIWPGYKFDHGHRYSLDLKKWNLTGKIELNYFSPNSPGEIALEVCDSKVFDSIFTSSTRGFMRDFEELWKNQTEVL